MELYYYTRCYGRDAKRILVIVYKRDWQDAYLRASSANSCLANMSIIKSCSLVAKSNDINDLLVRLVGPIYRVAHSRRDRSGKQNKCGFEYEI